MKTRLLLLLIVFFSISSNLMAAFPTTGDGTAGNPYIISTAAELASVRDDINVAGGTGKAAAYYELSANIDLSATATWVGIGTSSPNQFKGNFNGKGFKITGVKGGTSGSRNAISLPALMGLFGLVNGATISNLEVGVAYYLTRAGSLYGGGLVAQTDGGTIVINNCKVTGTVDVLNTQATGGYAYAAGVVGQISSTSNVTIINSSVDATLTASCTSTSGSAYANAAAFVADVAATATVNIVNCYALGAVTATSPTVLRTFAGGILASAYNTNTAGQGTRNIINCYAANSVDGYSNVGGIAANMGAYTASQLNNCIALNSHVYGATSQTLIFRISPLIGSILSNNYALNGLDIKAGAATLSVTSLATGKDGETLSASDPAGQTLTKLNAYVTANPTYGGITLKLWRSDSGSTYPIIKQTISISGSQTASVLNNPLADVIIPSDATLTLDATSKTVNSLTVAPGGKLTKGTGTFTATNGITLQSSSAGTATLVDNTMSNPQAITATVEQRLDSTRNWYITPPISGAAVPNGQIYYSYNEKGLNTGYISPATEFWVAQTSDSTLIPGRGYIVQPGAATTLNFTGILKTGNVNVLLSRTGNTSASGYNLVANPYPSYLNWQLVDTAAAKIMTTVWYRTQTSSDEYTFDTYNGKLNAATTNGVNLISNLIPPMQAFWVRVKTGETEGTLTFTNVMRSHVDNTLNKFKSKAVSETKLVRLRVSNGVNRDETLVCFHPNAQNSFDGYDSQKRFNSSTKTPEIYTQVGLEKLVINGMNAVQYDTEIPLGFVTSTANDFKIQSTEMKSFDTGTRLVLIDKLRNTEFDLTEGVAYNFSSEIETQNTNRFSLVFRAPGAATAVNNIANFNAQVFVNIANKITIQGVERMKAIVYNSLGQKLNEMISTDSKLVDNSTYKSGVYFVEITANGNSETHKVVIR